MAKAQLEAEREQYRAHLRAARAADAQGFYRDALAHALAALPHVDGAMQYERKYEEAEFSSVAAIDLVLRYAPLLLHAEALDRIESLLKQYKRIEKLTAADMAQRLADARTRMWQNHRLFALLEAHPETRQDQLRQRLGGDQDAWRATSEAWEKIGLLERVPERPSYRLAFVTRMGQLVPAKCPSCGHVAHAPKSFFLETMNCPGCEASTLFVLLVPGTAASLEH